MSTPNNKARDVAEREQRIIDIARLIAEEYGWSAVTTRRLADEIDYSQPVLYSHFPDGKSGIRRVLALQGFRELTDSLRRAVGRTRSAKQRLTRTAAAYLDFGQRHPAVYEAMFALPTELPFADPSAPEELRAAFDALTAALPAGSPGSDLGARTEVFWATLHGLVTLARDERIRVGSASSRITVLVDDLLSTASR